MPLTTSEIDWLGGLSGLDMDKQKADAVLKHRDLLADERDVKLAGVKSDIKSKLASIKVSTGLFSSARVLDEEGGQMSEFDYSDLDRRKEFDKQYQVVMREAMEKISQTIAAMRDARTTGLDEKGKEIEIPLYTEEQIAEEVYMPLVRERLMPEWLVPNQWSKTQEMLDASDALYKERLIEYTAELDEEAEGMLDAAKTAVTGSAKIAQKALAMVPGADAETASTVVGLVALGTTTSISAIQALSKAQLGKSFDEAVKGIGELIATTFTEGTGDDGIGKIASQAFLSAVSAGKIVHYMTEDPPNADKAIEALSAGIASAVDATLEKLDASVATVAVAKSAVTLFQLGLNAKRIREHVLEGNSEAILDELAEAASNTLEGIQSIVTAHLTEDASEEDQEKIEEEQEALTEEINEKIEQAKENAAKGKAFIDSKVRPRLDGMAEEIVDSIGDVLTSTLSAVAPAAAAEIGNAYRQRVRVPKVAHYMAMVPPEPAKAVQLLGEGFASAFALADNPALAKVGRTIGKVFVQTAASYDLARTIDAQHFGEGAKALSKLARQVVAGAMQIDLANVPDAVLDDDAALGEVEVAQDAFQELSTEVAQAVAGLNDEATRVKLQHKVMALSTASALEDIEASSDELERVLIQADQGGENAADTRSIELLIKQMKRERMVMEMALKLMSGGAALIEKVVPPMAVGGAAIKLAANLIKAAQRATALNTWIGNQKDMHRAVSGFETSTANFVKNQAEQFSHYAIQAALELARMIGEIVSCSGISSAAGVALSKGAALAIASEDVIYQFYKKADLENAWRVTRKAWAHPDSRKLGLAARRLNPTLAKYTLAWGAVVKRDALAQEAMRSCGLNALTLSQRDSNVSQVQKYLELRFNEDNVVLKRFAVVDWVPSSLELTVKSWTATRARGETKGGVIAEAAPGIEESLAELLRLRDAFDQAIAEIGRMGYQEAIRTKAYENLLDVRHVALHEAQERFRKAMLGYQPQTKIGDIHVEMRDVRDHFILMGDELSAEIDMYWQAERTKRDNHVKSRSLAAMPV